jgi:hypothetical protein
LVNGHLGDLVGYPIERCHAITAQGEPDIGKYLLTVRVNRNRFLTID